MPASVAMPGYCFSSSNFLYLQNDNISVALSEETGHNKYSIRALPYFYFTVF
jgi:hypothetical protein